MKARVRWASSPVNELNIDQTQLQLEGELSNGADFSFLVLGDSGSRFHRSDHPQRRVAEAMLEHRDDCAFILHTGDVVYLVGSREQYPRNFIEPYREFLVGGEQPQQIAYDRMVFRLPFLPVPGNHDYYDLPLAFGLISQLSWPLRQLLGHRFQPDIGWHGSFQGDAYARAFLDFLIQYDDTRLRQHLEKNYLPHRTVQDTLEASDQEAMKQDSFRCLYYRPGQFTRLPNRYYQFRQGGIDFFALDSNTFNAPLPMDKMVTGENNRLPLIAHRDRLISQKQILLRKTLRLTTTQAEETDDLEDCYTELEQIEEQLRDLHKQLSKPEQAPSVDQEQLDWLVERLIASWQDSQARGRVLYFHHPPYVTETTKWNQGQTFAVRHHLRQVLDRVERALGSQAGDRAWVDLVINGHAHCLEYLQTGETGHGDRNIHWLICGGSGFSLRRQRSQGSELTELRGGEAKTVAQSHLFVGRSGRGQHRHRPYSFARIDVSGSDTQAIYHIRPQVVEHFEHRWSYKALPPIMIDSSQSRSNFNYPESFG